jgi:hypothetical protein
MEIVLSTMSDSHSDLATAITAAITMPQRMLLSLSVVAAAVKSPALGQMQALVAVLLPYRPARDSKNPA